MRACAGREQAHGAILIFCPSAKSKARPADAYLRLGDLASSRYKRAEAGGQSADSDISMLNKDAFSVIHDSFVVAKEDKPDLIEAMVNAYHASDDARIRNSFTSIKDKQENRYYP